MAKARPSRAEDSTELSKSVRTRRRILDAAAQVLSRNGYAGTRLTDIVQVAELQAPAIYFNSREDVIEEVIRVGQRQVTEEVSAAWTPCRRTHQPWTASWSPSRYTSSSY